MPRSNGNMKRKRLSVTQRYCKKCNKQSKLHTDKRSDASQIRLNYSISDAPICRVTVSLIHFVTFPKKKNGFTEFVTAWRLSVFSLDLAAQSCSFIGVVVVGLVSLPFFCVPVVWSHIPVSPNFRLYPHSLAIQNDDLQ